MATSRASVVALAADSGAANRAARMLQTGLPSGGLK